MSAHSQSLEWVQLSPPAHHTYDELPFVWVRVGEGSRALGLFEATSGVGSIPTLLAALLVFLFF